MRFELKRMDVIKESARVAWAYQSNKEQNVF